MEIFIFPIYRNPWVSSTKTTPNRKGGGERTSSHGEGGWIARQLIFLRVPLPLVISQVLLSRWTEEP